MMVGHGYMIFEIVCEGLRPSAANPVFAGSIHRLSLKRLGFLPAVSLLELS